MWQFMRLAHIEMSQSRPSALYVANMEELQTPSLILNFDSFFKFVQAKHRYGLS